LRSIRFGSFNARSLSSNIKQDQLATDATHYRVDIIGIQEALTVNMQRVLPEGYLLLTLPSTTKRLGTGFAVAPHLRKHLQSYWAHNERIAILQVNIARNHRLNIISAYAPHMGRPPAESLSFYDDLRAAYRSLPSRDITIICGDFNAKLGQKTPQDSFMGQWCRGIRTRNGHVLANLCDELRLVAFNTLFRKRATNLTTWSQTRTTHRIFNQIDFILGPHNLRRFCTNAQSWGGLITPSDHKLVTADINLAVATKRRHHRQRVAHVKPDYHLLADPETRASYTKTLSELITANAIDNAAHPNTKLQHYLQQALTAASSSIGPQPTQPVRRFDDVILRRLSNEQRKLRLRIQNENTLLPEHIADLKIRRNHVLHAIRNRSRIIANERLDKLAEGIESQNPHSRMFASVKTLLRRPSQPLVVHDAHGHNILNRNTMNTRIKHHFEALFNDPNREPITPCADPKPLDSPITPYEVERAFRRLRNRRAYGPDGVPGELLKYGSHLLALPIANIINESFATGKPLLLGEGTLICLAKANKPLGECSSLRPIVLLNAIRKAISLLVL
ncbi:hypothetical protein LEN26_019871, partial [Aphanomyces euteiches]